jgi:hypothetical protein
MGKARLGPLSQPKFFKEPNVVERIVEKTVEVPVIQEVIKYVPQPFEVIKEIQVEVIKEVSVPVEVITYVERPVYVEILKEVQVQVEKIVEKPIEIIKEKLVTVVKKEAYVPLYAKIALIVQALVIIYLIIR